jgi:hypothetical protein
LTQRRTWAAAWDYVRVDLNDVRGIAERALDEESRRGIVENVVVIAIYEYPDEWVAFYNTRMYWETRSASHALAGNAPVLIDKTTGQVRFGTSALPIEEQLTGTGRLRWELLRSIETRPPCSEDALLYAEESLGFALPHDLRGLLRRSNGLYDGAGQWYFVWPLERIVADNLALRAGAESRFQAGLVAFGDNGTGAPFCIAVSQDQAICWWSPIDTQVQMLADSLDDFIAGWLAGTIAT